jgi:hypothetical protein
MISKGNINAQNIDDYIRQERQKGVQSITWSKKQFELLEEFIECRGFSFIKEDDGYKFLQVKHYMTKSKATTPKVKAKIKLLGRYYESEGKTVEEALHSLKIPVAKGVGVLTVSKGENSRTKVITGQIISNFFGNRSPQMKSIALKGIIQFFSDIK